MFRSIFVLLMAVSGAVFALPDSSEILNTLPFTSEQKQAVMQGQLATTDTMKAEGQSSVTLLAFIADVEGGVIKQHFFKENWGATPQILQNAKLLRAPIALTDLGITKFASDELEEAKRFLDVMPGDNLNLSVDEMKQIWGAKQQGSTQQAIEYRLQKILFKRLQDYRKLGIAGITSYQRADNQNFLLSEFLKQQSVQEDYLQKNYPLFYSALNSYPTALPQNFQDTFFVLKLRASNYRPTFVLLQRMVVEENNAMLLALRQFYVSQGYNGLQDLGLFVPIKQGYLIIGMFGPASISVDAQDVNMERRLLLYSMKKFHQGLTHKNQTETLQAEREQAVEQTE